MKTLKNNNNKDINPMRVQYIISHKKGRRYAHYTSPEIQHIIIYKIVKQLTAKTPQPFQVSFTFK